MGSSSIILHIGRHKTGTTSLQKFFALNDSLLARKFGILYPVTGRHKKKHYHHPLFRNLIDHDKHIDPERIAAILEESATMNTGTILLSCEMLARPSITDEQLEEIKDAFGGHAIKIIIYFRRQDNFLLSMYANHVRRGLLAAPETIYDMDVSLDYVAFAQRYARIFGQDAIIVRSYDNALRTSIFADMLETLGVKDGNEFRRPAARLNKRLPWRYLELLRVANKHRWQRYIIAHKWTQIIAHWLNRCFPVFMDNPKPLNSTECKSLLTRYEDKNAKLEKLFLSRESLLQSPEKQSPEKQSY
jgi:hypothetical protein